MELLAQYILLLLLTLLLGVRVLYGPALRRRLRSRMGHPIPVPVQRQDADRASKRPPGSL